MTFGVGLAVAWPSTSLPKLSEEKNNTETHNPLPRPITSSESAWIASLLHLGAILGCVLSCYTSSKFGRRPTIIYFTIPMLISNVIIIFSKSVELFYVARFLVGISHGCATSIVFVYLSEISDYKNRGLINMCSIVCIDLGMLFMYVVGPYVTIPAMSLIAVISNVLSLLLGVPFIPESPYFLMEKNDESASIKFMEDYYQKTLESIQEDLSRISKSIAEANSNTDGIMKTLKSKTFLKSMGIVNGLFFFHVLTGISCIVNYMQLIFTSTGTSISPEISVVAVAVVDLISAIISSNLVDRLGRKILLFVSTIGVCVASTLIGVFFYIKGNTDSVHHVFWLPLVSFMLFIFMFSIGLGPIPSIFLGEMFPVHTKFVSSCVSMVLFQCINFVIISLFPLMAEHIGLANTFFSFTLSSIISLVFIYFCTIETKGKTLEEIQTILR